jgi:hypothetical protein
MEPEPERVLDAPHNRRGGHGEGDRVCGSCADVLGLGISHLAGRQISQNLKGNVGTAALGRQTHHGGPVVRRDAPDAPATNSGVRLPERTSDRASAAQGRYD